MGSFNAIIGALVPVFGLVFMGVILRRWKIIGGDNSADIDRFVYYVALPAQLIISISETDIRAHFDSKVLIAAAAAYVMGLVGTWYATQRVSAAQRGSILNGAARANGAFVGLPLVHLLSQGLPREQGQALETAYLVLLAAMVPCFNVGAVIGFTLPHHGLSIGGIIKALAELPKNPIIIGSVIGVACSVFQPHLLNGTIPGTFVGMIGLSAIPLALILTGSHLNLSQIRQRPILLLLAASVKLVVLPALTWFLCVILGVEGPGRSAAVLLMACPTAMAAVSMARILSADYELMAALIAASTLLAPITLLAWMLALA